LQMEFDVASEMSPFFLGIVTSRSRSAVCRHQHCTIYCTTAALEHGYRAATLGRAGLSDLFLRMRSGTRAHARTAEAPAALATSRQAAVADIVHGVIAQPCGSGRSQTPVTGPGLDAAIDGIPRKDRIGCGVPAHQPHVDVIRRQTTQPHANRR